MFGVEGVDPSDWMPAAITGGLALLAIVLQGRKTRRDVAHRVGEPNGKGNVVAMATQMLKHQEKVLTRLGRIEAQQKDHGERLGALEDRSTP